MHWYHKILPSVIQNATKPFWFLYIKYTRGLKVVGIQHIQHAITTAEERGVGILLVSNHTSLLDFAFVLSGLMYTELYTDIVFFVGDESKNYSTATITWKKYFLTSAFFMKAVGAWPVRRGTGNYEIALSDHVKLLKNGGLVCIFPQGGIGRGEVHGGAGYLAEATRSIVVPVHISQGDTVTVSYSAATTFDHSVHENEALITPEKRAENYRQFAKNILNTEKTS